MPFISCSGRFFVLLACLIMQACSPLIRPDDLALGMSKGEVIQLLKKHGISSVLPIGVHSSKVVGVQNLDELEQLFEGVAIAISDDIGYHVVVTVARDGSCIVHSASQATRDLWGGSLDTYFPTKPVCADFISAQLKLRRGMRAMGYLPGAPDVLLSEPAAAVLLDKYDDWQYLRSGSVSSVDLRFLDGRLVEIKENRQLIKRI